MNLKESKRSISYDILKIVMKYMDIESKVRNYGTDTDIYRSEIHIISLIAKNPGIHVKGLAEKLGVASSSISEAVKKLEKKQLIRREISPSNMSKLSFYITTKGQLAHEEHIKYHNVLESLVEEELEAASPTEVEFLQRFLQGLLKDFDSFEDRI